MRRRATLAVLAMLGAAAGCGAAPTAAEAGAQAFGNPKTSSSPLNSFSCATCHHVSAAPPALVIGTPRTGPIDAGFDLGDVVHRPSWWGGYETRLIDALNYCLTEFMGAGAPFAATDDVARQLYAYLDQASPTDPAPALPLTVVKSVNDLAAVVGDAGRGADVYDRACRRCHGAPHTGAGRLGSRTSIVPEDTIMVFPTQARAVVVEKIRHGKFFNIGGLMPLYAAETISDQEISDILTYLGL